MEPLQPTFRGFIKSERDILQLVEGCLQGYLNHGPRRPADKEAEDLCQNGNIFIFERNASAIQEWHDGLKWTLMKEEGYIRTEVLLKPGCLCKISACVSWRDTLHYIVSYQYLPPLEAKEVQFSPALPLPVMKPREELCLIPHPDPAFSRSTL